MKKRTLKSEVILVIMHERAISFWTKNEVSITTTKQEISIKMPVDERRGFDDDSKKRSGGGKWRGQTEVEAATTS